MEKVAPLRLKREQILTPERAPIAAKDLPIASILVDTGLLHLDDEFDFLVPDDISHLVLPGSLVRVTFNGKRTQGVVLDRKAQSTFQGRIRFLSELIKPFPVVTQEVLIIAAEIKRYYGGTRWDVLRFALPPLTKKARGNEKSSDVNSITAGNIRRDSSESIPDPHYQENFWRAIAKNPKDEKQVRAYWSAPPGHDPFFFLASLVRWGTGNAILLLPDQSDVERMFALIENMEGVDRDEISVWHSNVKRREREEIFLHILKGDRRIVIGVRGSILLPMPNLDLIILWDEGNDSYSEQRSPYYHAREVAIMRSHIEKTHLIIGGYSPTLVAAEYVNRGYLALLSPSQALIKSGMPTIRAITNRSAPEQSGRFPTLAWQVLRKGLEHGAVIVQAQLRGYIQSLSCSRCFNIATCPCGGKLISSGNGQVPECFLCGSRQHNWNCAYCSNRQLRNSQIGDERLVEELGRTFPNTRIISSNAQHRILEIDDEPVIVIATPGTEPVLKNGYSAGVIINSQVTLQRATLNAEEESRRRWFAFATLLRAEAELFIDSEYGNRNIQALVRWDGLGASVRELQERAVLSLPPFAKTVEVKGTHEAVAQVVRDLPGEVLISAPKSLETGEMVALIRISPSASNVALNEIFRRVRAQSARGSHVARLRVDPISF